MVQWLRGHVALADQGLVPITHMVVYNHVTTVGYQTDGIRKYLQAKHLHHKINFKDLNKVHSF